MDRFATSPSQEDASLLCKTKKKRKKGTVAVDEFSFLRRGKKSGMHFSISYLFSVHKAKKVSVKVGRDKDIKSLNHSGMEIQ